MDAKLLPFHEAANIFPMSDETLDDLSKDIRANGQQIPIEMFDGQILDGRRRYMACRIAGIEPRFVDVSPDDPVAYVLSLNLHRRHLTKHEATLCAAKAIEIYKKAAKERQIRKPADSVRADLPEQEKGRARDQVAKDFGVTGRSVEKVDRVTKKGSPALVDAMMSGRMSINRADEIVALPIEQQEKVLSGEMEYRRGQKEPTESPVVKPSPRPQVGHSGPHNETELFAINAAKVAVTQLKGIPRKNKHRKAAFEHVISWIDSQES